MARVDTAYASVSTTAVYIRAGLSKAFSRINTLVPARYYATPPVTPIRQTAAILLITFCFWRHFTLCSLTALSVGILCHLNTRQARIKWALDGDNDGYAKIIVTFAIEKVRLLEETVRELDIVNTVTNASEDNGTVQAAQELEPLTKLFCKTFSPIVEGPHAPRSPLVTGNQHVWACTALSIVPIIAAATAPFPAVIAGLATVIGYNIYISSDIAAARAQSHYKITKLRLEKEAKRRVDAEQKTVLDTPECIQKRRQTALQYSRASAINRRARFYYFLTVAEQAKSALRAISGTERVQPHIKKAADDLYRICDKISAAIEKRDKMSYAEVDNLTHRLQTNQLDTIPAINTHTD